MKKFISGLIYLVMSTHAFLYSTQIIHGQVNFNGTWEGEFMNDFKTLIHFRTNDALKVEGNLQMFAANNLIQDDQLKDIKVVSNDIEFYIPAKETSFTGSFNESITELIGLFIFPDGTKHPIQLKRKRIETTNLENFKKVKQKKIAVKDLHADLQLLYTTLKEQHPQLYTFSTKDSLDLLVEKIRSQLKKPLSLEEFYLQTATLTAAIQCSHTGVKLPATYQKLVNTNAGYFPLKLFFTNDSAYYISGLSAKDQQLVSGQEVLSINDSTIDEIIKQAFNYIPSEGCNTTTAYNELNKRFSTLFYLLDDSAHFNIKFKTGDGVKRITVSATQLSAIRFDEGSHDANKLIDFKYIDQKTIGVLKVRSFAIREMDRYFKQLDSIFSDLKTNTIQHLILDLRDNSGGHPIFAAQLLSYLTDKEFVYFKRNEAVKDFEPLYNTMQPNTLNFSGKVYVLVNGGCLSTTGHLISLLNFHTKALFIGEAPGSTFRCNDFSKQLALPASGILVNVPRTTFETAVSGFTLCEPFPLDVEIPKKAGDIIHGKDPYVDMVLSIVKK